MPFVMSKPDQHARLKPCLRCGYSLRNNIDARNCPECGLAVRISLTSDNSLEMSNPAWLRRLSVGAAVFLVSNVLAFMALFGIEITRRVTGFEEWPGFLQWAVRTTDVILGVSFLVLAAAAVPLGAAEGRHPDRTRGRRLLLAPCCAIIGGLFLLPRVTNIRVPLLAIRWLAPSIAVLTAAGAWSALHEPLRRAPARRAAWWVPFLGGVLVVGCAIGLLSFGGAMLFMLRLGTWSPRTVPLTLGLLVYFPVTITILIFCVTRFRAAAREAERNWVSDP